MGDERAAHREARGSLGRDELGEVWIENAVQPDVDVCSEVRAHRSIEPGSQPGGDRVAGEQ